MNIINNPWQRRAVASLVLITIGIALWYAFKLAIVDYIVVAVIYFITEIIIHIKDKTHEFELKEEKNKHQEIINKIKSCFPIFVGNFSKFCTESKKAISQAPNDSEILTIQTPLIPEENQQGEEHFKTYIDSIIHLLLTKNDNALSSKVKVFKRLIVINDKSDINEINQEKKKLKVFCDSLYDKLPNVHSWSPNLKNIYIGIVDANKINTSPFSHLDILLIRESHLVIAFSKEKDKGYTWGSSIHFLKNSYYDSFIVQIPTFENLYTNVWDKTDVKKICFGDFHDHSNLGNSKTSIENEVEKQMKLI